MKLPPRRIEGFLARPDDTAIAVLLYGPDQGLVRERAERLLKRYLEGNDDPFALITLSGEQLRGEPARLLDEAQSMSLLGGRRVVRVRGATDGVSAACRPLLKLGGTEARLVVEAGDLPGSSGLRRLFDQAKNAYALPCYRAEGRDLEAEIRRLAEERGLRPSPEALIGLTERLGADHAVSRREMDKLALYLDAAPERPTPLERDAVDAAIGDAAAFGLDEAVRAAFDGDPARLDPALDRLFAHGVNAVAALRAAQRHALRLLGFAVEARGGRPIEAVLSAARPPLFFKLKDSVREQLRRWSPEALRAVLARLLEAELAVKSTGTPTELVTRRALHDIAAIVAAPGRVALRSRAGAGIRSR